jgi:hypothetical protein
MYETGPELTGNWTIRSIFGESNTNITVAAANRRFQYIDATLETYYVTACGQLSSGLMSYTDMKLMTQNSKGQYQTKTSSIKWKNQFGATDCNGVTTIVSPTEVTIKHN